MLRRLALIAALSAATMAVAATDKKKGGGETFVQLPTLTATITRADHSRGVMTVDLGIDVPDSGLRHRALVSTPLLRDAYLRELLTYAPSMAPGAPPNPDIISAQLQRATDRTLGKPGAHVLLGTILVN